MSLDLSGPGPGSITTSLSNLSSWTSVATYRVTQATHPGSDEMNGSGGAERWSELLAEQDDEAWLQRFRRAKYAGNPL